MVKVLRLGEREVRWAAILGVKEDVLHWVIHGLTVCLLHREGIFSSPQGLTNMHISRSFVCICFFSPHAVYLHSRLRQTSICFNACENTLATSCSSCLLLSSDPSVTMTTSSQTPDCCLYQSAVPDMALGNQVSRASRAHWLSWCSLTLSALPCHKASFCLRETSWDRSSPILVTKPLVISAILHLAAVSTSLGSPVE